MCLFAEIDGVFCLLMREGIASTTFWSQRKFFRIRAHIFRENGTGTGVGRESHGTVFIFPVKMGRESHATTFTPCFRDDGTGQEAPVASCPDTPLRVPSCFQERTCPPIPSRHISKFTIASRPAGNFFPFYLFHISTKREIVPSRSVLFSCESPVPQEPWPGLLPEKHLNGSRCYILQMCDPA